MDGFGERIYSYPAILTPILSIDLRTNAMAERLRSSHVVATDDTILPMRQKDKTARARRWVYVGDTSQPYNVFDFTLDRSRDGPLRFFKGTIRCSSPMPTAATTVW